VRFAALHPTTEHAPDGRVGADLACETDAATVLEARFAVSRLLASGVPEKMERSVGAFAGSEGSGIVDPAVRPVLDLHDELRGAASGRPMA
jgi:hypothetical protein